MKENKILRIISYLFVALFFLVPLVFYPKSSEVFEFNKLILVYIITSLIVTFWIARMVANGKIIFRRTILDIPILIFLSSQIISTLISIDIRTSILGYYSRWNGGLLSSISYALLYWAFMANIDQKFVKKIKRAIIASGVVVAIYAILEHLGRSPSCLFITGELSSKCWVQDVVTRPFATFGQPNWLAAYLVAISPIAWKKSKSYLWLGISALFAFSLLFTKSRSGLLGFVVALLVYAFLIILKSRKESSRIIVLGIILAACGLIVGTPWTPNLFQVINSQKGAQVDMDTKEITGGAGALESGGTDSGEIRKIVWKGAISVFRMYPIFGSGVETFAISYYKGRPVEHNLVSEWNFIYNKAHNEYLNFLATTGIVGFVSHIILIISIIYLLYKNNGYALLSGFAGILVTNFFGFSVVPISILFFLYPALTFKNKVRATKSKVSPFIFLVAIVPIYFAVRYFQADYLYASGRRDAASSDYAKAVKSITQATKIMPGEAVYHDELAATYAELAQILSDQDNKDNQTFIKQLSESALSESNLAYSLSPNNVKLLKSRANILNTLVSINPDLINLTFDILNKLTVLAPTDPTAYYMLGLEYAKISNNDAAFSYLDKAIAMKANYKNPHYLKAYLLKDSDPKKAISELDYILTNISPDDENVKGLRDLIKANSMVQSGI